MIPLYILGMLLRYGPQHGYQLKKRIAESLSDFADIKLPTIYYHLEKMEAAGLLLATRDRDGARPEKTVYKATPGGEQRFAALLRETLEIRYRPHFDIDAALYFGDSLEPDDLTGALEQHIQNLEKSLAVIEAHRRETVEHIQEPARTHAEIIFRHHIRHFEAERDWALASIAGTEGGELNMVKTRIIETNEGIQSEVTVELFDRFARTMRDRGWNGVEGMIASGIRGGDLLEIGPGPGYVGLELAKRLRPRSLTGCEISPAMLAVARGNAAAYGIDAAYVQGNCMAMPFGDESFDTVISNGSLHEWENPIAVFDEIHRVLRPGGRYCVTDLRRDVSGWKKVLIYRSTQPGELRPGLVSSLNAAYTVSELTELLRCSKLKDAKVEPDFFGLCISGGKA